MRAILGRLSDLGLADLFKLLTSAGAEGVLEVEAPGGSATVLVRRGHAAGEVGPELVLAFATRSGTFCFRPEPISSIEDWVPQEEFLARLESQARLATRAAAASGLTLDSESAADSVDPLSELRSSLEEVTPAGADVLIHVFASDPRPYRSLTHDWAQRGWQLELSDAPVFPTGAPPQLVVLHLPVSGTLAGQVDAWLDLVRRAAALIPPAQVVWIGGIADAWLRHQAIMAGVDFILPAPTSDVGELARWFREELTAIVRRLLSRRVDAARSEGEALRDFFMALHIDAPPAEARASLLRFAAGHFARGALLAVGDGHLEVLGTFGFSSPLAAQVTRGAPLLEEVVGTRCPVRIAERSSEDRAALAASLGLPQASVDGELFPVLTREGCVAILLGDGVIAEGSNTTALAAVVARAGHMLGL